MEALAFRVEVPPRTVPASLNGSCTDDGDAGNGLGGHDWFSFAEISDFGVGNPGEIALGIEEVALFLSIEIGGIERTG